MKRFGVVLIFAVVLAACGDTGDTITIGLTGPFGEDYGAQMQRGAELALERINEDRVIRGVRVEFATRDDGVSPEQAIEIAAEFVDDPSIAVVVGPLNSSNVEAAAPVYAGNVAAIATSATAPEIGVLSDWTFRVSSSDDENAITLARYARSRSGGETAIVLYENDAYGRGLSSNFGDAFGELGGEVLHTHPYLPGTQDLSPYFDLVRRDRPDVIFLGGLPDDAARIVDAVRQRGLDPVFIGGDGVGGLAEIDGDYDGVRYGMMYHPDASREARQFNEVFRQRFGREADSDAALGYDAVMLAARAIREVGSDRRAIRDYLAEVGRTQPAHEGLTGEIRFDQHGDPVEKPFYVGMIRDGAVVLAEGQ